MREMYLDKVNWDEECMLSFLTKKGFEITEKAFVKDSKSTNGVVKSKHGIHSPMYATDWEDEDSFSERYRCNCGDLKGRVHEGETCKLCKTKVRFKDVDISTTGWIKLNNYFIIQPIFYRILKSIIGESALDDIIEFDKDTDRDGQFIDKYTPKHPFKGIGLIEFKERFDEIIQFYASKNKNKAEMVEMIMQDRDKIFASCIPVYTSVLRPVSFKGENFFFSSFDRKFEAITSLSRLLKDNEHLTYKQRARRTEIGEASALASIQKKVNELWNLVFDQISQKDGHIRYQILGGRVNQSARNVIIPDPTLKADEIRLGYNTFLELYKYEIISHLTEMLQINHNAASDEWYKATINFDPRIYEIMCYMIKKFKPHFIINRNPTISYGSWLLMRCIEVKKDMEDYTMSIPIHVLTALNADFDGDVLNIISLKTKKLVKGFAAFNPRYNMFISRNDGLFNNDFNLLKDQLIGLYEFNNCN